MNRCLIIVSGAPGSGKTTLAVSLAAALGLPLFSKDHLKETLVRTLSVEGELPATRLLGAAAMETMWMLAAYAPNAVLEANFRPNSVYEREKLASFKTRIVKVYCDCGAAEAARRFSERAKGSEHNRSAHPLAALTPELLTEYDRPVGVGYVVCVDTRYAVDIQAVARLIRAALTDEGG